MERDDYMLLRTDDLRYDGLSMKTISTLALVTLGRNSSVLPATEDWNDIWKIFSADGNFGAAAQTHSGSPTSPGRTVCGGVASTVNVPPGESVELSFVLAWHYP